MTNTQKIINEFSKGEFTDAEVAQRLNLKVSEVTDVRRANKARIKPTGAWVRSGFGHFRSAKYRLEENMFQMLQKVWR
jgi:transcription initiation factor IIE alpha subunit